MFPNVVFFLIFVLIMESILKSIKEKDKILEEKRKKSQRSVERPISKSSKEIKIPKERKKVTKVENPQSLEMRPLEKSFLEDIYSAEDEIKKGDLTNRENLLKPKKEDVLKGIIYSEILSKPKSLRR